MTTLLLCSLLLCLPALANESVDAVVTAAEGLLSAKDTPDARKTWEKSWQERVAETELTEETKATTMAYDWFADRRKKFKDLESIPDADLVVACRMVCWFRGKHFSIPEQVVSLVETNKDRIVKLLAARTAAK